MRIMPAIVLLAAVLPAQMQDAALPLSPSTITVDADLVLFELIVTEPDGVWLQDSNAHGQWIYGMEAQWMSLLADQLPITGERWSLPEVNVGINAWHYGPAVLLQQHHLRPGAYLLAMADDTHDPFRDPTPVVPVAAPTTFADGSVVITCLGYSNVPGVNPALERPPFAANMGALQPCDMTGEFPYSRLVGGLPPVSVTWEAGAQKDTCSGWTHTLPPTGFAGACSRWIVFNQGATSSHAAAVDLLVFKQTISTGPGWSPLPDAVAGVVLLGLESGTPSIIDVDLSSLLGLSFPNGGSLRYANFPVLWSLAWLNGSNLALQFVIGPDPSLVGVSMMMQAAPIDVAGAWHVTDLYSITFR